MPRVSPKMTRTLEYIPTTYNRSPYGKRSETAKSDRQPHCYTVREAITPFSSFGSTELSQLT